MHLVVFSTQPYDREYLDRANHDQRHPITYLSDPLTPATVAAAAGAPAVSIFVNDRADEATLTRLAAGGTRLIVLRCAGYDRVDLAAAVRLGLTVVNVPRYSPYAIAEHTVALLLGLVRRIHEAHTRVCRADFSLNGLLGFDLHGKTIGLIGVGQIGLIVGNILRGFGCRVIVHDPYPSPEALAAGFTFLPLDDLLPQVEVLSLHCPLLPTTRHLLDAPRLAQLKPGAIVLNTSRGALLDTTAVLDALDQGRLGGLAVDVYEGEAPYFFADHSPGPVADPVLNRLLHHPQVLLTAHQSFFTHEAMTGIAETTLASIDTFAAGLPCAFDLTRKPE